MESWRLSGAAPLMKCLLAFLTRSPSTLICYLTQRSMRGLVVFCAFQMILAAVSIPWNYLQDWSARLVYASNRWRSIPKGLVGIAAINRREVHGLFSLTERRMCKFWQQWEIVLPVCRRCVLWAYSIFWIFLLHRQLPLFPSALYDMLKPLNPREWHSQCILSVRPLWFHYEHFNY